MLKYLEELKALNLPKGRYALFGSTPLAIRNIRSNHDIDIIVKKDLWPNLIKKYPKRIKKQPICIKLDGIEIFKDWLNLSNKVEEMIDNAEIIDGLPFVKLNYLLEWKEYMDREKDKKDIKLVKKYLKAHTIKEENKKCGFIIINKPSGPTSHDIINRLRKITDIKKIGHAGTLDPFASGVLICAIGREATKEIRQFVNMDKEYVAEIYLGAISDTCDRTGRIVERKLSFGYPKLSFVKGALKSFRGKQRQMVPAYSATKIGGKKMYELARLGRKIARPTTDIEIYDIKLIKYKWPVLKIRIRCSSGTYIRTLAYDIGQKLKWGAYLRELERSAIGDYRIKNAVKIENLNKNNWQNYLFQL
ncbi:MAG: tRNA pseudouridine(55) synthase TruB [Patescibacteria group bacterium]